MSEIIERLFGCITDWGPGMLVAVLIIYVAYQLVYRLGRDVGLKIVSALEKPTDALALQAKSMDHMTTSLDQFVNRDQTEHREIIILLKLIAGRLDHIEGKRDGPD